MPKADVEVRDVVWLEQICAELTAFSPSVSGGPTQFTFWDIRFLARTVNGEEVVGCEELSVPIRAVARPLQEALAAFFSATYVSTYEDIVGLTLAGRYDEGILIAGELAQRACILALLQTTLVDPSPKWAISLLRESGSDLLQRAAAPLFRHLSGPPSRAWAVRLLALANGVVAAGDRGRPAGLHRALGRNGSTYEQGSRWR